MHITKFLTLGAITMSLAACQGPQNDWFTQYEAMIPSKPSQMQYGALYGGETPITTDADTHRISVLLPLTGDNAATGRTIRSSIELAVLQRGPKNLSVSFYDTATGTTEAINSAISTNPEIIIGPLFAADARALRNMKPDAMPVISFTSDATAIGNGIMTMALMPSNSVEAIVSEMSADGTRQFVILAPDTNSGRLMAAAARSAATNADMPVSGVFFYKEHNAESIKNAGHRASMYAARSAANTRAREILSDILTNERLTAVEKSSLTRQLNRISKSETLGKLPYDAVLFLGTADDAKSLASYLRYYGVGTREARFYGTAMWDGTDAASDFTLSGAKFAALPEMNAGFANTYEQTTGTAPSRLATFGYDATNLAMGMIYSDKSNAAYLLDPSGYIGIDGLFRLKPAGASERALRIVELDGSGSMRTVKAPPADFFAPMYNIEQTSLAPAREMPLESPGINPLNYIQIPDRVRSKYKAKTYGANATQPETVAQQNVMTILPEDDSEVITNPDFQPVSLESVGRTYIDSVEINE